MDLGGAEGKAPINLKHTEFSLNQFPKTLWQPNFGTLDKWKNVWLAGFVEKKNRSCIPRLNSVKWHRDGPLHCQTAVADYLQTFETWLHLCNFDNVEWIWRQLVEMVLNKRASDVRKVMKNASRFILGQTTDLGKRAGKHLRGNVPVLPNTSFMVVVH
jgi:hypothetical protein